MGTLLRLCTALATAGVTILHPLAAQSPAEPALSLDRLFNGDFRADGFGPAWWLEDSGLATLERAEGGRGQDLVRYDPETKQRTILVAAKALVPKGRSAPLAIAGYQFSQDGKRVLIFTNTRRVWRYHTRGDYWVLDRDSGRLQQIGRGRDPARLQFAKFDPAGKRVAYLYYNDIYVENLADQTVVRLTKDGSETRSNGTFDWVYEEEWGLRDGFAWSPDGESIAYWQIDAADVGTFHMMDNLAGLYSRPVPIRYPKVGTTNPSCRVGVVRATGGETRWIKLRGDLRNNYVARMAWANNSSELLLQRFTRRQNRNDVTMADVATGETRIVYSDRGEAWVEECDDVRWLADGKAFTWVSEQDGWRHLYVIARDGKSRRLVTKGDYDVVSIQHIDVAGGYVYFIASPKNPTQRFLYRVKLDGTGELRKITPDDKGTHAYQIAPNGRFAIHRHSAFGAPQQVALVELPSHRVVRTMVTNERLRNRLGAVAQGGHEFFRVDIGAGVELDGWMIRPPNFDPKKRYPLLVHVYGEPAAQTVLDRWGGHNYLWHLMLAQKGYVVISLDNRGTPAPRGRDWRKSVYRKIGIVAPKDQAAALRALQKRWAFLDRDRVGIWGWSGGGSMSLNAIFRYPDLYHTAIAIAFVANQRFYDTIYQERYMSVPSDNPEGFRDGSPITHAQGLKGNLLLVYGTGDDNCHYQNCEALVDELIRHNKQFEMQIYPNRTHAIREGRNTRRHLFTRMTGFLTERLPAGARSR